MAFDANVLEFNFQCPNVHGDATRIFKVLATVETAQLVTRKSLSCTHSRAPL